jgi:2-polyprenyl-6-methoxyphenol hydroxylase-like FAD-dependent oxidoreductase
MINRRAAPPYLVADASCTAKRGDIVVIGEFTPHAIIIGGGASGVLLAYQLLRDRASRFRATIIEGRSEVGRGIAYHTTEPVLTNLRISEQIAQNGSFECGNFRRTALARPWHVDPQINPDLAILDHEHTMQ